jgi:anti-sigma B factor antagonist
MPRDFGITDVAGHDPIAVVRVAGRLDIKNAKDLMEHCQKLRSGGQGSLVLNLSDVTFVASSGIGTLLALTEEFKEGGGKLQLVALPEAVQSVVNLLNLAQFLNIEKGETEALAALGVS